MRYASSRVAATEHSPGSLSSPNTSRCTTHSRHTAPAAVPTRRLTLKICRICLTDTLRQRSSTSHRWRCGASPATTHALRSKTDRCTRNGISRERSTPAAPSYSTALPTHRNLQPDTPEVDAMTPHRVSVACGVPDLSGNTVRRLSCRPTTARWLLSIASTCTHHADARSTNVVTSHSGLPNDSGTTTATGRTTAESLPDAASHADSSPRLRSSQPPSVHLPSVTQEAADRQLHIQRARTRLTRRVASNECPPRSKKLSSRHNPFDTQHLAKETAQHRLPAVYAAHDTPHSMILPCRKCLRSSFPFGVSGIRPTA